MWHVLLLFSVAFGHLLIRLAEFYMERLNRPFLAHSGAQELPRAPYIRMYILYTLAVIAAPMEYIYQGYPEGDYMLVGGMILFLSLVLRVWCIHLLGRMWSLFGVYIEGVASVRSGPYRHLAHPEYVSRLLEVIGVMIIFSALSLTPVFLIFFLVSMVKVVSLEGRQVKKLAYRGEKIDLSPSLQSKA